MEDSGNKYLHLPKPISFSEDSSNICIKTSNNDTVIVGNEGGCFITSLDCVNGKIQEITQFKDKEVPAICICEDNPSHVFYTGSERSIYKFDSRCSLDKEVTLFTENNDDINQIVLNQSGLLAACDDSGECKLIDTKQNKAFRTLRNRHKSICSSLSYVPNRPDEIITAGLDSNILIWNYKNVRLIQGINTQDILENLGDNSVKMFNPPFVNSIMTSYDGKLCAAGLGNGTMQIFHILRGKTGLAPSHALNGHSTTGISSVCFLRQDDVKYTFASGGNDCMVNIWNLPAPSQVTVGGKKNRKQVIPINEVPSETELQSFIAHKLTLDSKVNFLHSFVRNDKTFLLCADQTPHAKGFVVEDLQ